MAITEKHYFNAIDAAHADERRQCCADVCSFCAHKSFLPAEKTETGWRHAHELRKEASVYFCAAGVIHERAWREQNAVDTSEVKK